MSRRASLLLASLLSLAALGCAKPTPQVWWPPRVDLHDYGTVGLIEVQSTQGFGASATRQLLASVHGAQAGVPVLELGPLPGVLDAVGREAVDPETIRAIGERYHVDAVVIGELQIDAPRPLLSIASFVEATARAEIAGMLGLRLLDARSGATVWSDEAQGTRNVAYLNVTAGQVPEFGAVDPEGQYGPLVSSLVGTVTRDFRGHWGRP